MVYGLLAREQAALRHHRRVIFALLARFVCPVTATYDARDNQAIRRTKRLLTERERRYLQNLRAARHYHRCATCLSVVAVEGEWGEREAVECGLCGGTKWLYMGRVEAATLVKDTIKDVCNAECQCALGPKCTCKCGGANHGIGMVVEWGVTAIGALPKLTPPGKADKARAIAEEWTIARAAAWAIWEPRYGELCRKKWGGAFVEDFLTYLTGDRWAKRLREADKMTSQAGRLRVLAEVRRAIEPPAERLVPALEGER